MSFSTIINNGKGGTESHPLRYWLFSWDSKSISHAESFPLLCPSSNSQVGANDIVFACFKLERIDNTALYQLVLKKERGLIEELPVGSQIDGGNGLGKDSLTARFEAYNFLDFDEQCVTDLLIYIQECCRIYGNILRLSTRRGFIQCWANVMRPGQGMSKHQHMDTSDSFLSGIITVCTRPTKTILFHHQDETLAAEFPTNEGYLLLFPAYLPHGVTKLPEGENERVTIAFDLFVESKARSFHKRPLKELEY